MRFDRVRNILQGQERSLLKRSSTINTHLKDCRYDMNTSVGVPLALAATSLLFDCEFFHHSFYTTSNKYLKPSIYHSLHFLKHCFTNGHISMPLESSGVYLHIVIKFNHMYSLLDFHDQTDVSKLRLY
ncbi:unnamed protein product [Cuscuta europaea]|uniref:Uncharacterized protein n=1 Tax=Cuscuta europaea TaxID=41803 RepID=A0A9P0YM10_CUSEU|nr:unnamed protein product [Cuscuta europaea]